MSKEIGIMKDTKYRLKELGYDENVLAECDLVIKSLERLEAIDNANPSEALECLEALEQDIKDRVILAEDRQLKLCAVIKQALLKAQAPKKYVDELKLVEKKLKSLDLLMQELECKDFAELRKYARCGYEKLNKQYLKWEDLEFKEKQQVMDVLLNGKPYILYFYKLSTQNEVTIFSIDMHIVTLSSNYPEDVQFFNDLHLERVEE